MRGDIIWSGRKTVDDWVTHWLSVFPPHIDIIIWTRIAGTSLTIGSQKLQEFGFELRPICFCLPEPSISVAPPNVPPSLTQGARHPKVSTIYLVQKPPRRTTIYLRRSGMELKLRRGGVVAGGSHKSKMVQFSHSSSSTLLHLLLVVDFNQFQFKIFDWTKKSKGKASKL